MLDIMELFLQIMGNYFLSFHVSILQRPTRKHSVASLFMLCITKGRQQFFLKKKKEMIFILLL